MARNAQGELQGAIASVQALGNVFSPVVVTQTFFYFTHSHAPVYFPGAAFILAAIITAVSMIPLIIGLRTVPKVEPEPAPDEQVIQEPAASDTPAVATR